ncbi:MAG: hypothetical protein H6581_24920 [Bacteroidia bacterium]|nr:hypothetical protein [Bacteroidia bacterium]
MKKLKIKLLQKTALLILLAATGLGLQSCQVNSQTTTDPKSPVDGAKKPNEPVIVRTGLKFPTQTPTLVRTLKKDFDFVLETGGKEMTGKQTLSLTLRDSKDNSLNFESNQKQAVSLTYRLKGEKDRLNLTKGQETWFLDLQNDFVHGAVRKHLVLREAKSTQMAMLEGGSTTPFQLTLEDGIKIEQADKGKIARSDKDFNYLSLPVKISMRLASVSLVPGEQKELGNTGLKVAVLESEKRSIINPDSMKPKAFAEGPDYHYKIAIWR